MRTSALLALFVLFCLPATAWADELRPGYLELTQQTDSQWQLTWKAPMGGGVTPQTMPVPPSNCQMGTPSHRLAIRAMITQWPLTCTGSITGESIGLSGFETSIVDVLVRIAPLEQPGQALRLTASEPVARIATESNRWQVGQTYLVIGVEHIVFGFDHLLFVLALVFLLKGGWTIAKAVTAFTVAHSITLIGVTLGFFGLAQRPVEAVIALSILFLAVEILKSREASPPRLSERIPWLIAFIFGLLHGFGFAGALAEIGLPHGETPMALLAFNVGVELGQLAIVFAALLALAALHRLASHLTDPVKRMAAYAIGITAAYWFVERTIA